MPTTDERSPTEDSSDRTPDDQTDRIRKRLRRVVVPPELDDPDNRRRWKLEEGPYGRGPYLVELNVMYVGGLPAAENAFLELFRRIVNKSKEEGIPIEPTAVRISKGYYQCIMRVKEWRALVAADETDAIARMSDPHEADAPGDL